MLFQQTLKSGHVLLSISVGCCEGQCKVFIIKAHFIQLCPLTTVTDDDVCPFSMFFTCWSLTDLQILTHKWAPSISFFNIYFTWVVLLRLHFWWSYIHPFFHYFPCNHKLTNQVLILKGTWIIEAAVKTNCTCLKQRGIHEITDLSEVLHYLHVGFPLEAWIAEHFIGLCAEWLKYEVEKQMVGRKRKR